MDEQKFLETYKKRIIKEMLHTLCKKYKIYNTNEDLMTVDLLYKDIFTPKVIKRCIGTTNTVPISQCTRNAIENYEYCKTHLYKMCIKNDLNDTSIPISIEYNSNINNNDKVSNLKKKFIDDTFYLVDDKFIYDINYNKVGYIQNNEYILTLDPFILNIID